MMNAAWITTDSCWVRDQLLTSYPPIANKLSVIGIPVSNHFFTVGKEFSPTPIARPYLLAFGASDPRKNIKRLLAAFSHVRSEFPELELVLVGCQGSVLRTAMTFPGVRPRPYVGDIELGQLYRNARALVYPSLSEGFGLPILEAMAAGTAVVTSRGGSTEELASGAAVLVNPEDIGSIASGIKATLLNTSFRAQLIAGGHRRASAFSGRLIAGQVASLYRRVMLLGARHVGRA
jgi:glycosyltransferase involved in cell wall biosynthesis